MGVSDSTLDKHVPILQNFLAPKIEGGLNELIDKIHTEALETNSGKLVNFQRNDVIDAVIAQLEIQRTN